MEPNKTKVDCNVTIALLIIMAGIAIVGISMAMEPLTLYDFNMADEASKEMLLKIFKVLKYTRMAIIIMLLVSILAKSFQFAKSKRNTEVFHN